MKTLTVKKIELNQPYANSILELNGIMDSSNIEYNKIDCVNWPNYAYPNATVEFRIAHAGNAICLQYRVREPYIKASSKEDAGSTPYKDSCVEMFIVPDNIHYYNLEQNCIGKGTFAGGAERTGRTRYTQEVLNQIVRHSTLPEDLFKEKDLWSATELEKTHKNLVRNGLIEWKLDIILPINLFSLKNIEKLDGLTATANFYNCGDEMPQRHYLSWNPIDLEKPNFHTPQFFGKLIFE